MRHYHYNFNWIFLKFILYRNHISKIWDPSYNVCPLEVAVPNLHFGLTLIHIFKTILPSIWAFLSMKQTMIHEHFMSIHAYNPSSQHFQQPIKWSHNHNTNNSITINHQYLKCNEKHSLYMHHQHNDYYIIQSVTPQFWPHLHQMYMMYIF